MGGDWKALAMPDESNVQSKRQWGTPTFALAGKLMTDTARARIGREEKREQTEIIRSHEGLVAP